VPRDRTRKEVEGASPERFRFPLRPAPKPRSLADGTIEWAEWRGSPELLAHVVDAADAALLDHGTESARCSIVVAVKDDREIFDSADAFRSRVTHEALHDFSSIEIGVTDELFDVDVSFVRGIGAGQVLLSVSSWADESELVDDVRDRIRAAVDRERPRRYDVPVMTGGFIVAAYFAVVSVESLLGTKDSIARELTPGVGVVVALLTLSLFWVRPSVEVAPVGQTRLWRIAKFLGTTLVAIIVAGIVKALFR
jgi:hypothetical protein